MPRQKKLLNSAAAREKGGYINIELDEDDRASCRQWLAEPSIKEHALQQLIDGKYQLKVSYDQNNDCYACYVSGHWKLNKLDADWTLTGRGSTVDKAIGQALYKHFVLLKNGWEEFKEIQPRQQNWD